MGNNSLKVDDFIKQIEHEATKKNGRPEYTDEQYQRWLNEMEPFLKAGYSLYFAIDKTGLIKHKTTIYEKCRLKDWFSEKIGHFQSYPGEIANEAIVRLVYKINEKIKQEKNIKRGDFRILKFFCTHHRSCKPFFVMAGEGRQIRTNKTTVKRNELCKEEFEEIDRFFHGKTAEV